MPYSDWLVLRDDTNPGGRGQGGYLGKVIGNGHHGVVFDLRGGWPYGNKANDGLVVAKWFREKYSALKEIENLKQVGKFISAGADLIPEHPAIWAILPKVYGSPLKDLPMFARAKKDKKWCEKYMNQVRESLVRVNKPLLKKPRSPMHGLVTPRCSQIIKLLLKLR